MIESTRDYSIFKTSASNRDLKPDNLKKLRNSIKYKNLLHLRPILLDSKMNIIDGQHRLAIAKELGLEVFYEKSEEATVEDIVLLNENQKGWTPEDYLKYYVSTNHPEYIKFKSFMDKKRSSVRQILNLFRESGGNAYMKFRRGAFKFPESTETAELCLFFLKDLIQFLKQHMISNKNFLETQGFAAAFFYFIHNDAVEYNVFKNKIEKNIPWVHRCGTREEYVKMFTEIYNYRNKSGIE